MPAVLRGSEDDDAFAFFQGNLVLEGGGQAGGLSLGGACTALDVPTHVSVLGWVWCHVCHGAGSQNFCVPALSGAAWAETFGVGSQPCPPPHPSSRRHRTGVCTNLCKKHAPFPPWSNFNVNFNSGTWGVPMSRSGQVPSPGVLGSGCRERCRGGWGCWRSATSCILGNYCSFSFHLFRFPFVPRSFAALPTPLFQPVKPC